MPELHSRYFSASASKRWLKCAASSIMPQIEKGDTSAADEGTMGHFFTEMTLRDRLLALADGDDPLLWEVARYKGKMHKGWRLAEQHIAHLQGYVDFVWQLVQQGGRLYVENQLRYDEPLGVAGLDPIFEAFGTGDALVFMPDGTLWVIDLKFGKWEVAAERNTQGMLYAIGAWRRFRLIHKVERFNFVIYQPRTRGPAADVWPFSWEILNRFEKTAYDGAQRILEGVAEQKETGEIPVRFYAPGPESCEWCRVETCPYRPKARLRYAA